MTEGNVIDYNYILKTLLGVSKEVELVDIGYDSYNSTQFVINAEAEGLPMAAFSQTLSSFNAPTKFFTMLVLSKKCIIDNNPVFDWMMANVEIGEDHNNNQKPFKAQGNKNNKIDAVISSLEALGTYLHSKWFSPEAWVLN